MRLSEHKQAVKRGDPKNGIAVHAHESSHMIDWDGARVRRSGMIGYWQRRTTEAIHIKLSEKTMNLDGGLQLSTVGFGCSSLPVADHTAPPEPTLINPWVLVGLCPFTPHKIHYFHPYHYYHITHYYYYLVLFHSHYSLLLLLLMTCHLSPHQRHSRLYNVTRLLYILGQSLTTFFSIVLTKTFAVETSTFLSVSSLLRDCSKICRVVIH